MIYFEWQVAIGKDIDCDSLTSIDKLRFFVYNHFFGFMCFIAGNIAKFQFISYLCNSKLSFISKY